MAGYNEAKAAHDKGDFKAAFIEYQKLAEQGNADGQNGLGAMYASGQGVKLDYAQAIEWYRKSAEQGNAKAQFNLGVMYYEGEGVPQDYAQAMEWYRKSAAQGLAPAQGILGVMYYEGEGVPQNYTKAMEWFRKSAEQGDANAQRNLGVMYEHGEGVPQDYAQAMEWYRKSAEQGDAEANEYLAKVNPKIKEKSDEEEQQKIIDNIQAHASKLLLKRESESKKLAKYYALTEVAEMCSVRSRYWINDLINGITVAASEKRNGLTNDEAKAFMALVMSRLNLVSAPHPIRG